MNIIWIGSDNFTLGRNGQKPETIVIHCMDGTLIGTDSWFNEQISNVSAHYGIGKNGEIHQYVLEQNQAWHAGVVTNPTWSLIKQGINPNTYTIGIEHEGLARDIWTPEMKKASSTLIKDICTRWSIPIDRKHIIGHYEINSVKKPNCPAYNKEIIDELITMANAVVPSPSSNADQIRFHLKEIEKLL